RAAECDQQFPPSEGDSHTPLPCEVRKGKDTTPRACCPNGAAPGAGGAHVGSTSIGRFALALRVGRGAAASESLPAPVYLSAGIVLARLIAPCEGKCENFRGHLPPFSWFVCVGVARHESGAVRDWLGTDRCRVFSCALAAAGQAIYHFSLPAISLMSETSSASPGTGY